MHVAVFKGKLFSVIQLSLNWHLALSSLSLINFAFLFFFVFQISILWYHYSSQEIKLEKKVISTIDKRTVSFWWHLINAFEKKNNMWMTYYAIHSSSHFTVLCIPPLPHQKKEKKNSWFFPIVVISFPSFFFFFIKSLKDCHVPVSLSHLLT